MGLAIAGALFVHYLRSRYFCNRAGIGSVAIGNVVAIESVIAARLSVTTPIVVIYWSLD